MDKWCWATRTALGKIWEVCQNHWPLWEDLTLNPGSYSEKLRFLLCRKARTCCLFRYYQLVKLRRCPKGFTWFSVYLHAAYCPHSTGWIAVLLIGLYRSLNSTPICCYCLRQPITNCYLLGAVRNPRGTCVWLKNPKWKGVWTLNPKPLYLKAQGTYELISPLTGLSLLLLGFRVQGLGFTTYFLGPLSLYVPRSWREGAEITR